MYSKILLIWLTWDQTGVQTMTIPDGQMVIYTDLQYLLTCNSL
jgi:hypothetical protein